MKLTPISLPMLPAITQSIFLVYDLGTIRNEIEFKQDLESSGNVSVLNIKH